MQGAPTPPVGPVWIEKRGGHEKRNLGLDKEAQSQMDVAS